MKPAADTHNAVATMQLDESFHPMRVLHDAVREIVDRRHLPYMTPWRKLRIR